MPQYERALDLSRVFLGTRTFLRLFLLLAGVLLAWGDSSGSSARSGVCGQVRDGHSVNLLCCAQVRPVCLLLHMHTQRVGKCSMHDR